MRLIKTETGHAAFKERSPLFSARQRSGFILFDGKRTVAEILAATAGLGITQADVDHLLAHGFLEPAPVSEAPVAKPAASASGQTSRPAALGAEPVSRPAALASADAPRKLDLRDEQERYQEAKSIATQLTASLGLRGFRLNLSVESASGYQELLALLPKIQDAVGAKACRELERVLKG